MKIAIVGHSGYIGKYLVKYFERDAEIKSILRLSRSSNSDRFLDLSEAEKFDYTVLDGIDYVILTSAISSPDQCASDFEGCWKTNVTGTEYFIRRVIECHCRVLFFSSDAVFGDISGAIYDEHSETSAMTPYGQMKKKIEDTFKEDPNFKAIRLSYVVSSNDKFVSYCLNCIQKGENADVFHPFYRNCITIDNVVDAVDWLIRNWDAYSPFVLNVAGKELVSRVRIADELNRYLNGALHYTISHPSEAFYRNRPAITQMKSLYLTKLNILPDVTFTEMIQNVLEELKT